MVASFGFRQALATTNSKGGIVNDLHLRNPTTGELYALGQGCVFNGELTT